MTEDELFRYILRNYLAASIGEPVVVVAPTRAAALRIYELTRDRIASGLAIHQPINELRTRLRREEGLPWT